jgi:phosphate:Na+ symporter
MLTILTTVLGGIGLFLLGMILMTDGLKALAGNALRDWLQRFTGRRRSAVLTGAGITALVQSSSATTLATIGFVSAGLLSQQNAIGVIIGANIGTTSTGWLVSLLGLKLSIGKLALPLIGVGALMKLLGRERLAHAGIALAGFGVIFVGIDTLQAGMAGLSEHVDPARFAVTGFGGRLVLVLIGALMTVVMQSSSAAVATTLTALSGGAITLDQAAALVIGQNVGTTVTAAIAAIGASTAAQRTALVHILFNAGTGAIALLLLPLFTALALWLTEDWAGENHALTIAAFHSLFNLIGAAIFLPLTPQLARLSERVFKERGSTLTAHLDASLYGVPEVALTAAHGSLRAIVERLLQILTGALAAQTPSAAALAEIDLALTRAAAYLEALPPPPAGADGFERLLALLHVLDHARELRRALDAAQDLQAARSAAALAPMRAQVQTLLTGLISALNGEPAQAAAAESVVAQLADARRGARPAILDATAAHNIGLQSALEQLAAQRRLEAIANAAWRACVHLQPQPKPPQVAAA